MKLFAILMLVIAQSAFAQLVWERNDQLVCVETKTNVDEVRDALKKKFGKDCDYLRDSTRIIIGHIFKCPPDDKLHPYFRSKEACQMFFKEGKKELEKFAPASAPDAKRWIKNFGNCMETATPGQYTKMGPRSLNIFCYCVAEKTTDKVTGFIVQECSKRLN